LVTSLAIILPSRGRTKRQNIAIDVLPTFNPRAHLAVALAFRLADQSNPLIDDLVDRVALPDPLRLGLPRLRGDIHAAADLAFEVIDLRPRVLHGEGFAVIDAELQRLTLAAMIGVFEIERRDAGRGDADEEAAALLVVDFDALGRLALAVAGGDVRHWFDSGVVEGRWVPDPNLQHRALLTFKA
jgi:hypothetical protein